jgi:hypothetical protein
VEEGQYSYPLHRALKQSTKKEFKLNTYNALDKSQFLAFLEDMFVSPVLHS